MAVNSFKKRKQEIKKLEINNLSREELIEKVHQLEAHNLQLRNTLSKVLPQGDNKTQKQANRNFDFSKHNKRHVALKFLYLGWNYQGLATQENTNETIEDYIFSALYKACLVEHRETSNYHRCGRTDKGVSSFCQVISIDLRSKLSKQEIDEFITEGELPYPKLLNRLLPDEIRIISWIPVSDDFSARFNCEARMYKYFFPRGNLNIQNMISAAQSLIGVHDFRNFCKMDVKNGVVNYIREISSVQIRENISTTPESPYDMLELTLIGKAFLWHQVRCIMCILLLVGIGKEPPEIVEKLLEVDQYPEKPQYSLASEIPLNLFHCSFSLQHKEVCDQDVLSDVVRTLQNTWSILSVKSTMVHTMLKCLESELEHPVTNQAENLILGVKPKIYKSLLSRPKCKSLEDRIDHYTKKFKLS